MSGWRRLSASGVEQIIQSESNAGWIGVLGEAWTYSSADGPTGVVTVLTDLTTKYSVGMKVRLTQTTVKYFVITKISYAAGTTTITMYGGTDYTLANAAISEISYSAHHAPFGFPVDPAKWTLTYSSTANHTQGTPTSGTWYQPLFGGAGAQLDIHIGCWDVQYDVLVDDVANAVGVIVRPEVTLSTANNSESSDIWTTSAWEVPDNGQTGRIIQMMQRRNPLTLTAKATYYLNARTNSANDTNIDFRGDLMTTIIRARLAIL